MDIEKIITIGYEIPGRLRPMLKTAIRKTGELSLKVKNEKLSEKSMQFFGEGILKAAPVMSDSVAELFAEAKAWNMETLESFRALSVKHQNATIAAESSESAQHLHIEDISSFASDATVRGSAKKSKDQQYRHAFCPIMRTSHPVLIKVTSMTEIINSNLTSVYDSPGIEHLYLETEPHYRLKANRPMLLTTIEGFRTKYHVLLSGAVYQVYTDLENKPLKRNTAIGQVDGLCIYSGFSKRKAMMVFTDESIILKQIFPGKKESEPNIRTKRISQVI